MAFATLGLQACAQPHFMANRPTPFPGVDEKIVNDCWDAAVARVRGDRSFVPFTTDINSVVRVLQTQCVQAADPQFVVKLPAPAAH